MQSDAKLRRDNNLFTMATRLCVVGDAAQIAACVERSECVDVATTMADHEVGGLAWGLCEDAVGDKALVGPLSPVLALITLVDEALLSLNTLIDRTAHREVFTAAYPAFLQVG